MTISTTLFQATHSTEVQQSLQFDTVYNETTKTYTVTINLYPGPVAGTPIKSSDFDLSQNNSSMTVDMQQGQMTVNGELTLVDNKCIIFKGNQINSGIINTLLVPGVIAVA